MQIGINFGGTRIEAAALDAHVFSDAWSARIQPAKWGDSSGVRGAARLGPTDIHPLRS